MTPRQQLRELINAHVNAQIALSWKGVDPAEEAPAIDKAAKDAERALLHFIDNHEIG